jgi:hypothetical protein
MVRVLVLLMVLVKEKELSVVRYHGKGNSPSLYTNSQPYMFNFLA